MDRTSLLVVLSLVTHGCADRPLPLEEPRAPGGSDLGAPRDLAVAKDLAVPHDLAVAHDFAVPHDLASACNGLDETSCRKHPECAADYCLECSCQPTFVACRAPSEPKTGCPGLGCAQPPCCSSTSACPSQQPQIFELCVAPSEWPGCGFCVNLPPCNGDGDCAGDAGAFDPPYGGPICDDPQIYGICGGCGGQRLCLSGCTVDTDCRGRRVCDAGGHCVFPACTSDADCASNFACANGRCARVACTADADCAAGFCVNGSCYEAYGVCMPAPF